VMHSKQNLQTELQPSQISSRAPFPQRYLGITLALKSNKKYTDIVE
jgi:hypothetical protein